MTSRLTTILVGVFACATTLGWASSHGPAREDERRFPHEQHARLFPTCETCHEGITTDDPTTRFPSANSCGECHDGARERRVTWEGPRVRPSNLAFSHPAHERAAASEQPPITCHNCHAVQPNATYMAVVRAPVQTCLGCHAHRASSHLGEDTPCAKCHVALTRAARLSDSTVAAIAVPEWHRRASFLDDHGPRTPTDAARCATCHARESCARCHPNTTDVARTAPLERDARVARVVRGVPAKYFTPSSHNR
jgi:hypothetical protein